jgi:hypothetical protein
VLVGAAVLRVAGGVFYGIGDPPPEDAAMAHAAGEETSETAGGKGRTPLSMVVPAGLLATAGLAVGLIPRLGRDVEMAAIRFQDQTAYNATVLGGAHVIHPVALSAPEPAVITAAGLVIGFSAVAGSVLLALAALYGRRLPGPRFALTSAPTLTRIARGLQSGVVNDYVMWLVVGLACVGGALALAFR